MPRPNYEEEQEDRRDRLEARAAKLDAEATRRFEHSRNVRYQLNGQPILIGHHSEKGHRGLLRRLDKNDDLAMEAYQGSQDAARSAAAVGKGGISSDDPRAGEKLEARLAELQTKRENMKAANRHWRKHKTMKGFPGLSDEAAARLDAEIPTRYSWERQPIPKYRIANLGANIRRIQKRIENLQLETGEASHEAYEVSGVRVEEREELNRVAVIFPAKPPQSVTQLCRRYGFRWSPKEVAWLRMLNAAGRWNAQALVEAIAKAGGWKGEAA